MKMSNVFGAAARKAIGWAVYDVEARSSIGRAIYDVEVRSAISQVVCYDDANMISMATMLIILIILSNLQHVHHWFRLQQKKYEIELEYMSTRTYSCTSTCIDVPRLGRHAFYDDDDDDEGG